MRANNIHLTLVFLGSVELARLEVLRALASDVLAMPFTMILDRLGWWKHNRVVWAAPETTPDPLLSLVHQLQAGLRSEGFDFDDRPVYSPHVTLLRNARCDAVEWPPFKPLEWAANDFVLVRSVTLPEGATYEAIGRWPLALEVNDVL